MAEIVVGDIVAKLRVDSSGFDQALTQAQQRLQQLSQAFVQVRQQQSGSQQATQQHAQALTQLTQTVAQQNQALQQLSQASSQAGQATASLRQQHAQLTSQVQQSTAAAQAAGSAWRTALSVAGGIGLATSIAEIIRLMKEFAVSTVEVATRLQSLRASLAALGGGVIAGQQQFAQLFQTAQALGAPFETLARGFRQLTAAATQANLPLEDQRRLLNAVTIEARRVGASNDELGRIITALAQAASKGVVSMEEWRGQLGEALPTALAALARGMGLTTEAVTKLIETGTLRFVPAALAFTRGLEDMQSASGRFADGATQAFNRLGNAMVAFKDVLGTTVLPALEVAARLATNFLDKATAILALAGGRRDPRLAPNMAQELAGTPEEEQNIRRLRDTIARLEARREALAAQPQAGQRRDPRLEQELQGQIDRAKAELDTQIELIQARKDEAASEDQVTAAANRTRAAREQGAAWLKTINEQLAEVQKKEAELAAAARSAPNVFGSPTGTSEQQQEFARRQQAIRTAGVEALQKTLALKPADVTITPAIQEALTKLGLLDQAAGKAAQTVDRLRASDQARAQAARELEAQRERVPAQVSALAAFEERLGAFLRRPTENLADEAASRVRVAGAAMQKELDTQIQALEASRPFQAADPGALERLRAQRAALIQTTDVLAQEAYTAALAKQLTTLDELARKYGFVTAEASDLAKAQDEVFKMLGGPNEEAALARLKIVQDVATVEAQIVELKRQAAATERAGLAAVRGGAPFDATLAEQLERLRAPREERAELRLRAQARREGFGLTPDQEAQLKAITAQERFNQIMQVTERLGDSAAESITRGLLTVIDGTERVGKAFQLMAKSVLDSIAQITLNEGFKALIRLGITAIGAAFAPGTATGALTSAAGNQAALGIAPGTTFIQAQGGAVVNHPTLALVGEGRHNPEYILNNQQMGSLVQSSMQAGAARGQGTGDVSVILVDNRQAAEVAAAQERALGRRVIVQTVVEELAAGTGSQIGRMVRAGGH